MEIEKIIKEKRIIDSKKAFKIAYRRYYLNRSEALKNINLKELKERARKIKEKCIENLDNLVDITLENLEKNGIKTFFAKNSKDAIKILKKIIPEGEVIVKSKSNVIKEIGFEEAFSKRNKIIETDCGDFVLQICGEKATHPVTPALHLSIDKIVNVIRKKFGINLRKRPEDIVKFVSKYLRSKILASKYGLTGANFITSDGSVVIVENEGNISLLSRIPKYHVIVSTVDKILNNLEEAMFFSKILAIYGTGTSAVSYINVISSPSKTADIEKKIVYGMHGAKEVYLILVDNNRLKISKTDLKEVLYCINCGACLYSCPVYRQIFDYYGKNYFGGIGISKTFVLEGIGQAYNSGLYFCTTCSSCKDVCPLSIDVPNLIVRLREISVKNRLETKSNMEMIENIEAFGNPFGSSGDKKILPEKLYCC